MKNDQQAQPEDIQPVAYDTEGRPLYHHPPVEQQPTSIVNSKPDAYEGNNFNPKIRTQYANEPDLVHATRPIEPVVPEVSDALKRKHDESVRQYPFLNLSAGEFVMLRIRRHPIGLIIPVFFTAIGLTLLATITMLVPDFYAANTTVPGTSIVDLPAEGMVIGALMFLMMLVAFIGGVAIWVYLRNQFFLTNEAVIQEIQHSLFSHHEQTVSLGSIEDASFKRQGILQHLFDYGTMRLSTEGEETTYRFAFVEDPKQQIAIVNNAVEDFKNGRPVGTDLLNS